MAALRASWRGWTARVAPARPPVETAGTACVLAPIAADALGVSEAFGAVLSAPGSDAGCRDISLNLWTPGDDRETTAPASPTPRPPGGWSDSATSARRAVLIEYQVHCNTAGRFRFLIRDRTASSPRQSTASSPGTARG